MKVLVFAHRLEIGGTQVNAIDLACSLRDLHGCEVILFATPGPLARVAQGRRLRFIPAPDASLHPSAARMRALRALVRAERPDVIHAWDWWQCLDAYYSVYLPWRVPLLTTDMMPTLARVLPKSVPTTFGTPEMVDFAKSSGRRKVDLLLPPVDLEANARDAVDPLPFRLQHGLDDRLLNVVTVSRLDTWLKSESLIGSIDAVRRLGRDAPIRFIIVGDGAARAQLDELALRANAELGRKAVLLTGALLDPRPAYAAADIVIGMGGSALRAMSFSKPVIVAGALGFSAPFNLQTAERFYYTGMYGVGTGTPAGPLLAEHLTDMIGQGGNLVPLGAFGRRFVEEHFALEVVSTSLMRQLQRAKIEGVPRISSMVDAMRTSSVYIRERRFLSASRAKTPVDDVADAPPAVSSG